MHVLLRDAVAPDERGESTHVSPEDALMNRELRGVTRQNDRVLVIVTDHSVERRRVAVHVVRIELLLLLQRRKFVKDIVGPQSVAVGNSPVRGLVVGVHDLVIFVRFVVVLSHGAYLLACHRDYG